MAKFWARRAEAGAWRSKSSLPGEHGRPCCSHMSCPACEVDRMHASCQACAMDYSHASCRACTADFSRPSRLIKQLHARHRGWLNFDMVNIIQPFAILTCQLFVSKRTCWLLLCVPLLKLANFFTTTYMCHKVHGDKRQRLLFRPQEGHVSLSEPWGLRQAPVCKRLVI